MINILDKESFLAQLKHQQAPNEQKEHIEQVAKDVIKHIRGIKMRRYFTTLKNLMAS